MAYTGLWIYMGQAPSIPVSGTSYPTLTEAQSLEGFTSTAFQDPPYPATNTSLKLTEVTWSTTPTNSAIVNNASGETSVGTYDVGEGEVSSPMNYTANYRAEFILADGTRIADGISIVHYENGDMFVRPSSTLQTDLTELPSAISGIQITEHVPTSGGGTGFASFSGPRTFQEDDGELPPIVCFSACAQIDTASGVIAAKDLKVGDLVRTRDAGYQPVRWIGRRLLSATDLETHPQFRPIRLRAGALGFGLPAKDLLVSPQHRVLVRSNIAQRMFGTREVLVAAKQLLAVEGVEIATDLDQVCYIHFLFDAHQIVFANGAETESLHTGVEALKSVGPQGREEIFALFPELADGMTFFPVRTLAAGRRRANWLIAIRSTASRWFLEGRTGRHSKSC
ncbi:Hint domain-containing protein [Paracoccus versutus]|uniref:Hint domain-containing protein n=1 Tax=Paracoccus versutus TaxID=34007 RepID=UPI00215DA35B|nr:Hint domain-containing protein [Paracoccus versutus]